MKLGICIELSGKWKWEDKLAWAKEAGFKYCQIINYDMSLLTDEYAKYTKSMLDKYNIEATEYWAGWHGPIKWNFTEGPSILGIVPAEYRASRTEELLKGAAFARKLGISKIITHLGFVPANSSSPDYIGVVNTVKYILEELAPHGQSFYAETGQETPVILRRLIEDVGSDRFFVNYDPSNLMAYGSGEPIAGLDLLGPYVKSVHAKDGSYPRSGYELGKEYPIGKGNVNFPAFIDKLKELGFDGSIAIEHELDIDLDDKKVQILEGKRYIEELWKE